METIIASCITGFVTLIVCLLTNRSQSAKVQAVLEVKLDSLTAEVRKHNSLVERVYRLETDSALHEQKLNSVDHRVSSLETRGDDLHG